VCVEIFDAEEEFAVRNDGSLTGDPESCGVTEVEEASWRGREASAIWWKSHAMQIAYI
jgi:hypothetical protein